MSLRITIISFAWPPRNSIGAHRPYSWAKYWSAKGAQVRVITARKYAYDEPLDLDLPSLDGVEVIEVGYQKSESWLASIIYKSPLKNLVLWIWRARHSRGAAIRNPREGWLVACDSEIKRWAHECDYVVSTYDPRMVHQIAAKMKAVNPDLHWTADYRDLWSLNHAPAWSEEQREAERKIEFETVGKYADLVTSVSEPLAREQGLFLEKNWATVTNGFDVDEDKLRSTLSLTRTGPKQPLRLVYTGKIYPGLRDPSPLLEAIVAMELEGVVERGAIEFHIYGGQTDGIDSLVKSGRFDHILHLFGHVSRDISLDAQREADLLILLESPRPDAAGVLTGKIFEYMATGIPILSLGSRPESAIGQILSETGTGVCTEDETNKIRSVLQDCLEGGTPEGFAPCIDSILKYSRKNQADQLFELITDTNVSCIRTANQTV